MRGHLTEACSGADNGGAYSRGVFKLGYACLTLPDHVSAICSLSPEQASALHSTFSREPEENTRTFGRKSQGDDMAAPGASAVWLSSSHLIT